jgi:hypothetical protein
MRHEGHEVHEVTLTRSGGHTIVTFVFFVANYVVFFVAA